MVLCEQRESLAQSLMLLWHDAGLQLVRGAIRSWWACHPFNESWLVTRCKEELLEHLFLTFHSNFLWIRAISSKRGFVFEARRQQQSSPSVMCAVACAGDIICNQKPEGMGQVVKRWDNTGNQFGQYYGSLRLLSWRVWGLEPLLQPGCRGQRMCFGLTSPLPNAQIAPFQPNVHMRFCSLCNRFHSLTFNHIDVWKKKSIRFPFLALGPTTLKPLCGLKTRKSALKCRFIYIFHIALCLAFWKVPYSTVIFSLKK